MQHEVGGMVQHGGTVQTMPPSVLWRVHRCLPGGFDASFEPGVGLWSQKDPRSLKGGGTDNLQGLSWDGGVCRDSAEAIGWHCARHLHWCQR